MKGETGDKLGKDTEGKQEKAQILSLKSSNLRVWGFIIGSSHYSLQAPDREEGEVTPHCQTVIHGDVNYINSKLTHKKIKLTNAVNAD